MPIAVQIGNELFAIHTDHLNTPRRLTDHNGQAAWQWPFSGFGEVEPATAYTGWIRPRLGSAGEIQNASNIAFDLRYPGQQYDKETGLYYNHHRVYDPYLTVGYLEADPIGLDGGWNRFAYVGGNALSRVDPLGLEWIVDPSNRPPDGTGANTIYCQDADPAIHLITNEPNCPAIGACVKEHEQSHLTDAALEKPKICRTNTGRIIIVNNNDRDRLASEEKAMLKEIDCLNRALNDGCNDSCRGRIQMRIRTVEWILNNQVRKGKYP